jgi:anhydro-N-acetylmuramic acid kinase
LEKTAYQLRDIIAIGNHGQTIRHRPDCDNPFSLQIGNAHKLAQLTGIDVMSDFRSADIHAGGQGAPLAPAFLHAVFRHEAMNRIIVNTGGISNITILPADKTRRYRVLIAGRATR